MILRGWWMAYLKIAMNGAKHGDWGDLTWFNHETWWFTEHDDRTAWQLEIHFAQVSNLRCLAAFGCTWRMPQANPSYWLLIWMSMGCVLLLLLKSSLLGYRKSMGNNRDDLCNVGIAHVVIANIWKSPNIVPICCSPTSWVVMSVQRPNQGLGSGVWRSIEASRYIGKVKIGSETWQLSQGFTSGNHTTCSRFRFLLILS